MQPIILESNNVKFQDFNLNKFLLRSLEEQGLTQPTLIQEKSYSTILSGRDVMGIAQTGTGKTLAYLLPAIHKWKFTKTPFPQILIIVPTRELVTQVVEEVEKLTQFMTFTTVGVYGGANIRTQAAQILQGVDLVVGTPGRTMDLIINGNLNVKNIKTLIIDEMDETLNLGFSVQLFKILDLLPEKKQSLLFSATMNEEVEKLIDQFFINPILVEATPAGTPVEKIEQSYYQVPNFNTKINLLRHLIQDEKMSKALIFVNTKKEADRLFERCEKFISTEEMDVIHSNKSQNYRFNTIDNFKEGSLRLLIATDLVARGIDINGVTHVINFNIPEKADNYIHRIGRSGRIGKKGNAISIVTPDELPDFKKIEKFMNREVPLLPFPENVEVSETIEKFEIPEIRMKNMLTKAPSRDDRGAAFHEKKAKNMKTENIRPSQKREERKKNRKKRR